MSECLFCKIAKGELPCKKVYEDEYCLAFHDLYPKAPVHVLVIPKKHIESLAHLQQDDKALMGHITVTLAKIAAQLKLDQGFKTAVHTGKAGGQEVFHLHFHIMGAQSRQAN